jgi:hypothetical protein
MEMDWAALPLDVLASIFAKLSVDDVLSCAGLVCHPWFEAAKVPDLWRSIDMAHITSTDFTARWQSSPSTTLMAGLRRSPGASS